MQGQEALMFNFQAHSRGGFGRHVALIDWAQRGTLTWQSALPEQLRPPQGSDPTAPGSEVRAPH